jgi:hypothetical protein
LWALALESSGWRSSHRPVVGTIASSIPT